MEQSSKLRKIRIFFHGSIKKFQPAEEVWVNAETAMEALRAMIHLYPEMKEVEVNKKPVVQVVGVQCRTQLQLPWTSDELHLVPAMMGSGGGRGLGALFTIVIGVAIAVAAPYLAPAILSKTMAAAVGSFGIAMALGGVMQLFQPAPQRDTGAAAATDPEGSRYLGSSGNTTKLGTPIPIAYGVNRIFGHFISFDVRALDMAINTNLA